MNDPDKMARELLAAECRRIAANSAVALEQAAITAIHAALLTAPPGWKLMPVEPTEAMQLAATDELVGGCCSMCSRWECSKDDAHRVYAAMIATALEVEP